MHNFSGLDVLTAAELGKGLAKKCKTLLAMLLKQEMRSTLALTKGRIILGIKPTLREYLDYLPGYSYSQLHLSIQKSQERALCGDIGY